MTGSAGSAHKVRQLPKRHLYRIGDAFGGLTERAVDVAVLSGANALLAIG